MRIGFFLIDSILIVIVVGSLYLAYKVGREDERGENKNKNEKN